jgi:hypothetical protein
MSGLGRSINEDESHAYVDNQLDMARHSTIDLYLHEHPDETDVWKRTGNSAHFCGLR